MREKGRDVARWGLAGLGAGLALTGTMLALGLWLGAPPFPEQIGDRLLFLMPGWLSSAALERPQFGAKPLLFVAIVLLQVLAVRA